MRLRVPGLIRFIYGVLGRLKLPPSYLCCSTFSPVFVNKYSPAAGNTQEPGYPGGPNYSESSTLKSQWARETLLQDYAVDFVALKTYR